MIVTPLRRCLLSVSICSELPTYVLFQEMLLRVKLLAAPTSDSVPGSEIGNSLEASDRELTYRIRP